MVQVPRPQDTVERRRALDCEGRGMEVARPQTGNGDRHDNAVHRSC